MKWLVTGASGFVGSVIAREAAGHGHEVVRVSQRPGATGTEVLDWKSGANAVAHLMKRHTPDVVFHAAGSASVGASMSDPVSDYNASVGSWAALLEGIRQSDLKPLIFFPSSAAVYGNPATLPVNEDAPLAPISPYGHNKVIAERLATEYRDCFGLSIVVLRLFSVFGPSQRRLLVREFFERSRSDAACLEIAGTGRESRDFLSEWCMARAVLALAENFLKPGGPASCKVLNLASGVERSISEVAERMRDLVSPGRPITCLGQVRPGDPTRWHADITRLQRRLPGWRPLAFEEALKRTIDQWQPQPSAPAATS
jgi:UDP-glucose 4-epimerase